MAKGNNALILNIPHASTIITDSVFACHIDESDKNWAKESLIEKRNLLIELELKYMTDWYTDIIFNHNLCPMAKADFSRLVCDIERFDDKSQEPMEKKGMGFCYIRSFDGSIMKDASEEYESYIHDAYYMPYHNRLTSLVDNSLEDNKKALILDCHSFYPRRLPFEEKANEKRPDICIGTDSYHTPRNLEKLVYSYFDKLGYTIAINYPYSGTMVPMKFYRKDKRVSSIMVELNRSLYMDIDSCKKNRNFNRLKREIKGLEKKLIDSLNSEAI